MPCKDLRRLGEILVSNGIINQGKVEEALAKQRTIRNIKKIPIKIGSLLVTEFKVPRQDVLDALKVQKNTDAVDLHNNQEAEDLSRKLF